MTSTVYPSHHLSNGDGLLAHVPSHPTKFEIEFNNGSYNSRLIATTSFRKGDLVTLMKPQAKSTPSPSYLTVQVDQHKHIDLNSDLLYCNHSCQPNVRFDVSSSNWSVIAETDIQKGDSLTFFYPSTEWTMSQPFKCDCNSGVTCLGQIDGASSMATSTLASYFLNSHIIQLKLEQLRQAGDVQGEQLLMKAATQPSISST